MNIFNLFKTAMGERWGVYRGAYEWFKYDDIINGDNDRWNRWARINHSLAHVLKEITHEKIDKEDLFMNRYGLTKEQVSKIYFVYIAYNPHYGIYACHVGPYHGPKTSDSLNKFGYFTRRYPTANKKELNESYLNYINKRFQGYKDILDMSDFKMVIKNETDTLTGRGYAKKDDVTLNIDPTSEQEKKFYARRPVMGTGSYLVPNAQGIAKMLQKASQDGNWSGILQQTINDVAQKNGIAIEAAQQLLSSDEQFVHSVYDQLQKVIIDMAEKGNPAAQLMGNLPSIKQQGRVGAQRTEALDTKPIQRAMVLLKKEIIETMVRLGTQDPQQIMDELNKPRKEKIKTKIMAQGVFTPEIFQYWLNYINQEKSIKDSSGNVIGEKSAEQLLTEANQDWETMTKNTQNQEEGFDSLEKTFEMLSLYFTEAPKELIDPVTRMKMAFPLTVPPIIDFEEEEKEQMKTITSEQLRLWRTERDKQIALEEATKKEMERDIGEEADVPPGTKGQEGEFDVTEVDQEKGAPKTPKPTKETIVPTPQNAVNEPAELVEQTEQGEEKPEIPYKPDIKNLMGNSLIEMVRIAQELDNDGKAEAAEEIHRIIRKYI